MQNRPTAGARRHSSTLDHLPHRSYRDFVRNRIREMILSGEFRPGQHLNELDMAVRFGVSATPVREAFRELEQTGLIVVVPHRGAVVRSLTHQDLAEMYSLRAHLERLGVRLALPNLTQQDFDELERLVDVMEAEAGAGNVETMVEVDVAFHQLFMERSGHRLLLRMWEQIHPSQWTYVTVGVLAEKGPLYIARRHRPLLEVVRTGSAVEAEGAMSRHIDEIGVEALEVFDAGLDRNGQSHESPWEPARRLAGERNRASGKEVKG